MATTHQAIVVGGGISGLACAYALRKSGKDVVLLEASGSAGGMIRSVSEEGFLFESGPQSFSTTAALATLIDDLKLSGQMVTAPPGAPRYILVKGRLRPVPFSPPEFLTTSLLGWAAKFSILREPFGKTTPPDDDESIANFVRRKFSMQLLELLVGPFVSGIYAGDPEKLSLRAAFPLVHAAESNFGSVLRGLKAAAKARPEPRQKPSLASFRDGNVTLTRALSDSLGDSVRTGTQVLQISRDANQEFEIAAISEAGSVRFHTPRLVLATPAQTTAALLEDLSPSAAEALRQIEYAPVAVVSLGYLRAQMGNSLNGFGFLVPRSEGRKILGTVWNSSLFPGRAPQDGVLLTSFVGGATDPLAASLSSSSLSRLAHGELSPLLGINGQPAISRVTAYERAIPQYNLGHIARLVCIQAGVAGIPGLHLTGNYFSGPAIGACAEHAQAVAESMRMG